MSGSKQVTQALAEIERLRRDDLVARWTNCFGRAPASKLSSDLSRRMLAFEVQAKAWGGVSAETRRVPATVLTGDGT